MADKYVRVRDNNENSINPSTEDTLIELIKVLRNMQNVIPYSRDSSDQMRVIVGNTVTSNSYIPWANNGTYTTYYATGAPASMDVRDMELTQSQALYENHHNRWTFS